MTPNIVKIGDRETGLLFGYTCYKLFVSACYNQKTVMMNEGGELTVMGLSKLFEAAYHNYCMANREPIILTYDDVSEWVDKLYETDEGQAKIVELCKIWSESKEMKKLIEETEKKSLMNGMMIPESPTLTT